MRLSLIILSIFILISWKEGEELRRDLITITSISRGPGNLYYFFTSPDNSIIKTIDASGNGYKKIQVNSEEISPNGNYNLHRLYISANTNQIHLDSYFNVTLNDFVFSHTSCLSGETEDQRINIGSSFVTFSFRQEDAELGYMISSPNEGNHGRKTYLSRNPLKPKRIDLFEGHDFIYTFLTNTNKQNLITLEGILLVI